MNEAPLTYYTCPVCGYDQLDEPPYSEFDEPSYNICAQCGTEFGLNDVVDPLYMFTSGKIEKRNYADLRQEWIAGGCRWWSEYTSPPEGWDVDQALDRLLKSQ